MEVNTPKEAFEKAVEENRIRKKVKEFLAEEFDRQSISAQWEFLGIQEV